MEEAYKKLSAENRSQEELVKSDTVKSSTVEKKMSMVSERAAGFSIMFIMIMLMLVTGVILDARKNGVWSRILSTPSSRMSIVGGYLLSFSHRLVSVWFLGRRLLPCFSESPGKTCGQRFY